MLLALLALLCSACGQQLTCDSPQPYQASIEVEKVRSPDGLDTLLEGKEMDIPRASPQDPRPPGSPCLDLPPTIQSEAMRRASRRGSDAEADSAADTESVDDDDAGATDDEPGGDEYGPPQPQ